MTLEGQPLPRISDLVMTHVPGPPSEKLAWLQMQKAAGKLDSDDPEEIAEAEALLALLVRLSGSKGRKEKRHLDELLDEGLKATFPASDPVSVGHFTGTEAPSQPPGRAAVDSPVRPSGNVLAHRRGRVAEKRRRLECGLD